jgi:hypothetical protein
LSLRLSRFPALLRARDIVVGRDAQRGAVEIVMLPAVERPQKAGKRYVPSDRPPAAGRPTIRSD